MPLESLPCKGWRVRQLFSWPFRRRLLIVFLFCLVCCASRSRLYAFTLDTKSVWCPAVGVRPPTWNLWRRPHRNKIFYYSPNSITLYKMSDYILPLAWPARPDKLGKVIKRAFSITTMMHKMDMAVLDIESNDRVRFSLFISARVGQLLTFDQNQYLRKSQLQEHCCFLFCQSDVHIWSPPSKHFQHSCPPGAPYRRSKDGQAVHPSAPKDPRASIPNCYPLYTFHIRSILWHVCSMF